MTDYERIKQALETAGLVVREVPESPEFKRLELHCGDGLKNDGSPLDHYEMAFTPDGALVSGGVW